MDDLDIFELAEVCRTAVDQELYGGRAPSSSNALTEVCPSLAGRAAVFLIADEEYAVVVGRTSDLIKPA